MGPEAVGQLGMAEVEPDVIVIGQQRAAPDPQLLPVGNVRDQLSLGQDAGSGGDGGGNLAAQVMVGGDFRPLIKAGEGGIAPEITVAEGGGQQEKAKKAQDKAALGNLRPGPLKASRLSLAP